jgi:cold shock CspA family protein/glycosyltransferase involved in cell wall biosynthesis
MTTSRADGRVTSESVIVTLATAWGTKFGGINAFNAEMVKSLGILPTRHYELICVVPGPAAQDLREELRLRFHIRLVSLEAEEAAFVKGSASEIVGRLNVGSEPSRFIWIGHDDKTGPLALELKSLVGGSHAVLISHMAYGAYQAVKTGSSLSAAEKRQRQLDLFSQADLCLAVGPMLRSHLQDLLACVPRRPPVEMLVPGLADPTEYGVAIRDAASKNFVAFIGGRLEKEDDRIKQGRLALCGFGKAVREAVEGSAIRQSPTLRMRGIRSTEEECLRDLLMQEAGGAVNFDFRDYTEDRTAYFRDLASASVAMMPSWHEGFGLTAWEAIASAVPVVISEESGVYRLLKVDCSGAGLGQSVAPIQVDGWLPFNEEEPTYTSNDVARVADALLRLGQRPADTKLEALTLRRNLLAQGLDWKGTARGLVKAIQQHVGVSLSAEHPATSAAPTQAPVEVDRTVAEWLRLPARRGWRPGLQLPTSMLLTARDGIARFDPERQPVLDRMAEWASQPTDLSARLLFGPGGMGKTRLALELARQLQGTGWLSLWLSAAAPEDWIEEWTRVLVTRKRQPVLLVIDYADARTAGVLAVAEQALGRLRAGEYPAPIRLLLLARSESWLRSLPQHVNCSQDLAAWLSVPGNIETEALRPWRRDDSTRLASYRTALSDYAVALGRATPPNAYVPRLSERVFERPLYLHLAALAALEGQRPSSAEGLLRDQLRREWHYWLDIHGERVAAYEDWSDALAYIILCQGADTVQLRRALEVLGVGAPTLATEVQRSYPSLDCVAALEPDLLADALLRERLAERRGSALLDAVLGAGMEQIPSALPVIARLAADARAFEPKQTAAWAQVLSAALARHWPRHPNEWLAAAHRSEFGLGEVLFAAWQQLDESARTSMAECLILPEYSMNLMRLIVAVRRQQLRIAGASVFRASPLNNLALALFHLGDGPSLTEALACAREEILIRRELAVAQPARYLPRLATSLTNLAMYLSYLGDADSRIEALACAREAVLIHRHVGKTQPTAHLPDLAAALNNLAIYLSAQGDTASRTEAISYLREALLIRRQLAATQPAASLPDLATSLNNLAVRLSAQGKEASRTEALACAREAVLIYRQLAETEPAAYLPGLAAALNTLANRLAVQEDAALLAEALACAREGVLAYRQLAATQPSAYLRNLAAALGNLAVYLSDQGDAPSRTEAVTYSREALLIRRRLAETQPAAYLPDLAKALNKLAVRLSSQGEEATRSEALSYAREAVLIYRQLAEIEPAEYQPGLAAALNSLANRLAAQRDAALRVETSARAREAVLIYRQLAATQPSAYLPGLAISLNNLSHRLADEADAGLCTEALACAREAVLIDRQLAEAQPPAYLPDLAAALSTLANRLSEQGDPASRTEALACLREVRRIGLRPFHERRARKARRIMNYESEEQEAVVEIDIRRQAGTMSGRILSLNERGFGFIQGYERRIFFHRNQLKGVTFDELDVGDAVIFEVADSAKGQLAVAVERA